MVNSIFQKYPALAKHRQDFAVFQGRPMPPGGAGGQLESYPPEELFNPIPGKATTEVFNDHAPPDIMQNLVAGDMLHRMGAVDAQTQQPVDPQYRAMKMDLISNMTPEQMQQSQQAYDYYRSKGWNGTFEDFLDMSRGDELIMGSLTPDQGDYWRGRPGTHLKSTYSPEQETILNQMRKYLTGQP